MTLQCLIGEHNKFVFAKNNHKLSRSQVLQYVSPTRLYKPWYLWIELFQAIEIQIWLLQRYPTVVVNIQ